MSYEQKKRGPKPKHSELPKEIRENINEANLPGDVLDAIKEVAGQKEIDDKPKQLVGRCPVTGKDVWL